MATTSSTLVAGKAAAGQGGNGKHHKGRVGGLVATTALGLSLLVGVAIGQGQRTAVPVALPASANAVAGARPAEASIAGEYRWDFGAQPLLPGSGLALYRVSAPNERDPEGTATGGAVQRPASASTAAEYRWDFAGVSSAAPVPFVPNQPSAPLPADASTSTDFRWDFAR